MNRHFESNQTGEPDIKTERIENTPESVKTLRVMINGMMFINCTKETIDRAVENENRRKAYFRIDEWENIP